MGKNFIFAFQDKSAKTNLWKLTSDWNVFTIQYGLVTITQSRFSIDIYCMLHLIWSHHLHQSQQMLQKSYIPLKQGLLNHRTHHKPIGFGWTLQSLNAEFSTDIQWMFEVDICDGLHSLRLFHHLDQPLRLHHTQELGQLQNTRHIQCHITVPHGHMSQSSCM